MRAILLWISLGLCIVACKDDSEPDSSGSANAPLVGTWNFTKQVQDSGEIHINGALVSSFTSESSDEQGTYVFRANGRVTSSIGYVNHIKLVTLGVPSTEIDTIPLGGGSGTYFLDQPNNTLTIKNDNNELWEMEVLDLADNKVVAKYTVNGSQTDNGVVSTTRADITVTLTR